MAAPRPWPPAHPSRRCFEHVTDSLLASPLQIKGPLLQPKCHGVPVAGADADWQEKPSCVTQRQLYHHMAYDGALCGAAKGKLG